MNTAKLALFPVLAVVALSTISCATTPRRINHLEIAGQTVGRIYEHHARAWMTLEGHAYSFIVPGDNWSLNFFEGNCFHRFSGCGQAIGLVTYDALSGDAITLELEVSTSPKEDPDYKECRMTRRSLYNSHSCMLPPLRTDHPYLYVTIRDLPGQGGYVVIKVRGPDESIIMDIAKEVAVISD